MSSDNYWTEKKITLRHLISAWLLCVGLVVVLAFGAQLIFWVAG